MSSKSFFSDVVKVDKQRMSDEGDDSPPRPKRKIKRVVILSSSSESEGDDNVGVAAGSRRKKLRIISDEEDNDSSSGSSIICAGARRRRTLPKLKDSDADSDSSGWATDRSDVPKPAASTSKATSGFTSDSSEGNSDKCSICLLRFTNQEVGTPENCEHIFCLDCIVEWSKNVNTCPVDRMVFNSIVVRACAGGRVLRTQPVKVTERRPSLDFFVIEDPTVCEICGSAESEESILLCDGCDLGYHLLCLTPPLTQVPPDEWLCPNCYTDILDDDDVLQNINLSEVEDLLDDILDTEPSGPRPSASRQQRIVRRSSRNVNASDQPSTSTGRGAPGDRAAAPAPSRGARTTRRNTSRSTTGPTRSRPTKRRKYRRRRTNTVIIEYEVQENGKFPVTRKVTKRVKKRRVKSRQPRTAARRTHVRASVRARLAAQHAPRAAPGAAEPEPRAPALRRQRAGIQRLRIFGNPHELEYFSDENDAISEEASTAVAFRPTANAFSAYRQARRKMISVPSPPHASSAPDILSDILESQTLLHSKNSIMSISVDGNVNIKLQTERLKRSTTDSKKEDKIELSKANAAAKSVPSYPGQSAGGRGGGWGGGHRGSHHGSHHRDQPGSFRGNPDGYGGYQSRQGNSYNYQNNNNNMRRDDTDYYDTFPRRPQQYPHNDDTFFDRSRRPVPESNRGSILSQHHRTSDQSQGRYGSGPPWQPYGGGGVPRHDVPPTQARHSFGGFETPVDMRMGQMPPISANVDTFLSVEAPRQEKNRPQAYQSLPEPHAYRPLSEPPVFNFPKISEVEKSEDEKSDSGLVIDTEKYDPTEPTNDDDSGDDETTSGTSAVTQTAGPEVAAAPAGPAPPSPPPALESILAGIDTSVMNVPPNILDTAVRQVLKEHRNLIVPPSIESHNDRSDDDSDGDCPNFSIYSAASVHIANNSSTLTAEVVVPRERAEDSLEDLVQEDDETPPPTSPAVQDTEIKCSGDRFQNKSHYSTSSDYDEKKKSEEEYKEKVSKRCPITTNKRNPIKIKLNTPSLIKRQVSLYDEEDTSQDVADTDEKFGNIESAPEGDEGRPLADDNIAKVKISENSESSIKSTSTARKREEHFSRPEDDSLNEKNSDDLDSKEISDHEVEESVELLENKLKNTFENGEENLPFDKERENNIEGFVNSTNADDAINDDDKASSDSERELCLDQHSPKIDTDLEKNDENIEKMTESVSETEDERSYTPCLDENKSTKDASFDAEKEKGIEGLDTEMISEDEGNEMFSENERAPSETFRPSPAVEPAGGEEGEVSEKKENKKSNEGGKKKKKKDSKKEGKERSKNKKKSEISFKKLSKSGKERNYRERDKDDKKVERERRDSGDEGRQRRRKAKRKDLERYDVRTVVTEKRRKQKDPFGRDVSPRGRSPSPSPAPASPARRSPSVAPARRSPSGTRSLSRARPSPARGRRSGSRARRSLSGFRRSPSRGRRSVSRGRRSASGGRRSPSAPRHSPARARRSPLARKSSVRRASPVRGRSPSPPRQRRSPGRGRRSASTARRRSGTPQTSPRRRSPPRRKRRRSASRASRAARSPPRRALKKKKRARSGRRAPAASPARKRRRSASRPAEPAPPEPAERPPSPRTPPPGPEPGPEPDGRERERRRRDPERPRRRARDPVGPSKEVFTSGDNILVSVSFKDQERGEDGEKRRRREGRRERRRRRRAAAAPDETAKPVAIIDLERSPFRELTPSPENVIVLSDSEPGERDAAEPAPAPAAAEPAPSPAAAAGPKTPPSPGAGERAPDAAGGAEAGGAGADAAGGPAGAPSPDAYDPFEPTRSPSASPARAPSPPRAHLTLEAAQRSNLSADEVLARRPLTPVEKVMALLQSTREAEEAEAEAPAAPRIVLPSPTRAPPKLFPGKPSPIKSNPVKPMQAARLPRAPSDGGASPYSPGSSDFGELFEPPVRRARAARPAARAARPDRKRGKTQVGVKLDEDNLKILDELPSSAVELQVKSKFLKKLNRQERVVEEVKLVLKPHYNKKRVTKEEYKDILRRAVPKICHNKSGEINPTKIQALVEAYVKKFRKKHKLGVA